MKTLQKKVCLLGDFAVGKTSLIRRFVEGRFDEKYLSTIGVNISRKPLQRNGHFLNFIIWDLAGGESFTSPMQGYLRGTAGALIVCDLTRKDTLLALSKYAEEIKRMAPQAPFILLGNKADLLESRSISIADLTTISHQLQAPFLLTSAKSGMNVEAAFTELANHIETVL